MKRIAKISALLLTLCMLMPGVLSSCGGYKSKYDTVMEYNGIKLTEEMYYYWLSTYKRNILASYEDAADTKEFWEQKYDENKTVEQYFTEIINERIMNYLIAQDLYKKNSLKLSNSVKESIKLDLEEKIYYYGGRSELNKTLSDMMLNIDGLEEIYYWEEKHDCVYEYLFGKGGALEITDKELEAYYTSNYYRIDYVVVYLTGIETDEDGDFVYDENGDLISKELSADELEKKHKKISEIDGKIKDGAKIESLKSYNEYDTSDYENGFYMSANEVDIWGLDIYNAVKDANVGDIVKVEESDAVFYVQRLELTDISELSDKDILQLSNLTLYATNEAYDSFYSALAASVKINNDVISRYKLSEIKANPHYSI